MRSRHLIASVLLALTLTTVQPGSLPRLPGGMPPEVVVGGDPDDLGHRTTEADQGSWLLLLFSRAIEWLTGEGL
jgi:hypothetical protein